MTDTTLAMLRGITTDDNITTTSISSIHATNSPLAVLLRLEAVVGGFAYGFGFIGNLLSLIVFYTQKEFRKISTGLLFLLLSLSNLFHLWTLATEFLTIFNIILFRDVFFQCRLTFFIQNISRALSTYIMVTISIDRFIRSELPVRSKLICTKRNVIFIILIYLVAFILFWSFYLYPWSTLNLLTGVCDYSQSASYYFFYANIYYPLRAVFVCFIPVIIMLLTNIWMLMNVRQSKRRIINGPQGRTSALDRMLFLMMVANVGIFIVTQLPLHIYSCLKVYLMQLNNSTALLVRAMLLIWSSLYFGIAFYFYCLTSPLFRKKLGKIRCHRRVAP